MKFPADLKKWIARIGAIGRAALMAGVAITLLSGLSACRDDAAPSSFQGYGEGEFTYLSATEGGNIEAISVSRGTHVTAGKIVFTLENTVQVNRLREAQGRLEELRHRLNNLLSGKREQEVAVLLAGQKKAYAAQKLSSDNLKRKKKLYADGIVSHAVLDQAEAEFDRDKATTSEFSAQITAARLTARVDEIGAAEAVLQTASVAVENAQWYLQKRSISAPKSGRIEEVLFEVGEYVQPGQPVLSLLPDDGIKVRFFIPESRLSEIHEGQSVTYLCDGCPPDMAGIIRFISKVAEYTPPVIFSQPSQQKLVFMAEAWPVEKTVIHPGQPVEVRVSVQKK
ncbi:MAG: HlyD family efflux transporter periplasmic adaptor subunit [Rhodospirillales bacterium]|nr:HlyD family efflux transporter periplasmic adaptor subunit [Rhodospirillales bacterium]